MADLNIDGEDGIKAISILRKIREVPCSIYSMYSDLFHVKAALAANVQGYVSKKSSTEELLRAIHTVAEGRSFYCTETMKTITKLLYDKSPAEPSETQMLFLNYKSLSRSEKELFELLAEKKSIAEIASALGKSEKTILNKRTIICQKLLLHDRLDIVDAAKTLGVIG